MLLVGLVDISDEVPVGDLGVVNAGEAFDPEPFARVDLLIDRIDRAGKDQALVSSRISTTCPTSTPSANGGWSTVWREAVVRVPSDPEIESVPAR
jgi:ribosome modulation factor